jgi:plasmid maintenance system killer protein
VGEVKFTKEELKKLRELQEGYLSVQSKFGQVAIARLNLQKQADELRDVEQNMRKEFDDLQVNEKEIVSDLTGKYGQGTLDPKTGVFTKSV